MRIRYYVLPEGDLFTVLRESKRQGFHSSKAAAIESAVFMASIEAGKQRTMVELFTEDEGGRLMLDRVVGPDDQIGFALSGKPRVIQVGQEEVLA